VYIITYYLIKADTLVSTLLAVEVVVCWLVITLHITLQIFNVAEVKTARSTEKN